MLRICKIALLMVFLTATSFADQYEGSHFIYQDYSKRISMDFKDAALIDILKLFSKQSGKNFIAASDISDKTVTLFFEDIPLEDALNKILDANNLTYEASEDSNVFIVKAKVDLSKEIQTKVYQLKYATVSSSKLNSNSAASSSSSSSESSSSGSSESSASSSSSASSGGGIKDALGAVLTKSGNIIEDSRTNSLIITDEMSNFNLIEKTIASLDVPVAVIMIEVEMLDVSKSTSDVVGIRYGKTPVTFKGGTRQVIYPWNQDQIVNKGYFAFDEEQYTTGLVDAAGMTAAIDFMRGQTDSKNLAHPRLMTLNNQTAEIKISTDEAVGVTSVTDNSSTGSSATTQEAERVQTGVFLTVTPQANIETGEILLAVTPRVIQARDSSVQGAGGQKFKDPEERGTVSTLRVKNGQTVVIGGLVRENTTKVTSKLPILGDIPILGLPFRHKDEVKDQRELIIFITPHIIDEGNIDSLELRKINKSTTQDRLNRVELMNKSLNIIESTR